MAGICIFIMVLVLGVLQAKVGAVPKQTSESKSVPEPSQGESTAVFNRSNLQNVIPHVKSEDVVNIGRNEGLRNPRGPSDLKIGFEDSTVPQLASFSPATYETSSWESSSTPYEENPNCTGMVVDMIRKITYCVNAWGQRYRSIPVATTTEASVNVVEEVSIDQQDLPYSDTSIMINSDNPEAALERFCPESVNCPVAQGQSELPTNPCCIQCDCSDACVDSGTCCLKKKHTERNKRQVNGTITETCVKAYLGDMSRNVGLQNTSAFMLVQSCLEEENVIMDSDTKDKCIDPDVKSLRETVPFFSSQTNKSYRNIYCARCNNDIMSGKYWDGYFSCAAPDCFNSLFKNSIESTGSLASWLFEHISEAVGGIFYWKPSSNDVKTCIAQDIVISTCNINNKYRAFLDDLCSLYYAPVKGKYGVYRNWFCLLCNDDGDNSVWNCAPDETDLFTAKIPLDEFLNSSSSVPEGVNNVDTRCKNGLQFDTSLNECVRKSCAITKVNVNGTCFSVMTHISEISFDYRLNIVYPLNMVPTVDSVLDSVRSLSLLPNDSDNCVERVLEIDTRREQIVVRVQLVKSVKELRHIQTEFLTFKQRVIRINEKAAVEQSQFEVEIAVAPLAPVVEGYVSFSSFADVTSATGCGNPIAMSELQFCDTVFLYDFTLNFNGIVYVENASFMPGEYISHVDTSENSAVGKDDTKSVSVCYDLYVSRVMESKGVIKVTDLNIINNDAISCLLSDKWLCFLIQLIILLQ